ncbi:magnesium chelatase subunit D [Tropicibacter sp. S64]|uniref:magnesium chelatase subunit D n=1 Tax=Tropicibacter sp. S64 TaxID=3415122 RepID=UPI003C7EA1C7
MTPLWPQAMRALAALAVDPSGQGGITLRARAGPVRQRFEDACAALLPQPRHRLHPSDPDARLFGGLDLSATLMSRRMVRTEGLAARGAVLVLTMAERAGPGYAARLAQLMDSGAGHTLILLDEGAEPEEQAPACLRDRLAFGLDLDGLSWSDASKGAPAPEAIAAARALLGRIDATGDQRHAVAAAAVRFGIDSLRAPLLALRAARALAALDGATAITDDHLAEAAALVFASRATALPREPDPDRAPPPPETGEPSGTESTPGTMPPEDMVVAAVAAAMPAGLLDRLDPDKAPRTGPSGHGAGSTRKGNRRGRPLPSRPGRADGRARIDPIATLRAAVPFQSLRRAARPETATRIIVTPADIRLHRFEERSDRLLIFAVDASGSAALARMNEAKGAIELFLARAYAQRDHVALISFRGTAADVLLPPTRALARAKRQLTALPGGGGTPLASGLQAALGLATTARHQGLSPALIVLTDGRGNITLNGQPGREAARKDAAALASALCAQGVPGVVIDTAARPSDEGKALALGLRAQYLALPRADANALCRSAEAALAG